MNIQWFVMPAAVILTLTCAPLGAVRPQAEPFPTLRGSYLGQPLPGDTPQPFAPGIVSCGLYTRDVTWTPDGTCLFFMTTRSNPAVPDLLKRGAYMELQAALTRPGNGNATIYWMSARFLDRLRPAGF